MAALFYTVLMCTVAVVLSTPASNEKWKLMGKLLTDPEFGTPTVDDLMKPVSPTPIGDSMCANLHHIWKGMPSEMKDKASSLDTFYSTRQNARPCYWSWNRTPPTCPTQYPPPKSICHRARYYAILGNRRFCCNPKLNKHPKLEVRLGQLRCKC